MTKSDLVQQLAQNLQISHSSAQTIVEQVIKEIVQALKQGERVALKGFGSFSMRVHQRRNMRHPFDGTAIKIPARILPHFKASTKLKNQLNQEKKLGKAENKEKRDPYAWALLPQLD